ncbi:hypothetical protein R1sor_006226 [Riccia sorocarpa]|uniref:Tryptophan synthase beta chain-like PALP domain-containing protein n=1 Tax=Riccia sorocarpa TaxID=122646 RepID=A0ABD3HQN3_9MARC
MLRIAGATFTEVPAVPYKNPNNYVKYSGTEIWEQMNGKVDGFIYAIGTGGTLAGVGKYLKKRYPGVRIGMADLLGAAMYNYYSRGVLESSGNSISEGIGQGRVTTHLDRWGVSTREGGTVDFCNLNR